MAYFLLAVHAGCCPLPLTSFPGFMLHADSDDVIASPVFPEPGVFTCWLSWDLLLLHIVIPGKLWYTGTSWCRITCFIHPCYASSYPWFCGRVGRSQAGDAHCMSWIRTSSIHSPCRGQSLPACETSPERRSIIEGKGPPFNTVGLYESSYPHFPPSPYICAVSDWSEGGCFLLLLWSNCLCMGLPLLLFIIRTFAPWSISSKDCSLSIWVVKTFLEMLWHFLSIFFSQLFTIY